MNDEESWGFFVDIERKPKRSNQQVHLSQSEENQLSCNILFLFTFILQLFGNIKRRLTFS